MKILFTKNIDEKEISEVLGKKHSWEFLDVIKINILQIESFPLRDKSLIFSSKNAVEAFFKNNFLPKDDFTQFNYNKIYCVGKKTKKTLRKYGFGAFKTKKNAKELAEFITKNATQESFLHFCGNIALDLLSKELPLQNIKYRKVVVYETELLYPKTSEKFDAIVFFSPSGVRSFAKFNSLENTKLFAIGETTAKELKNNYLDKIYTADNDVESLLELIKKTAKA